MKDNDYFQVTDGDNRNNFRNITIKELKEYLIPKKKVRKPKVDKKGVPKNA